MKSESQVELEARNQELSDLVRTVGKALKHYVEVGGQNALDALDDAKEDLQNALVHHDPTKVVSYNGLSYRLNDDWTCLVIAGALVVTD